ncbi:MAG: GatB/YqeY domain-containing protein [Bacteroidetes bacterium]|nr:GatB/YqeY domain-containing protein [Bacteroidota bacterium]
MSLDQNMNTALKEAMKAKDEVRLRTLRAIKSAFIVAKTAPGASHDLSEADELKIIQKLFKQRKDSYDIYMSQNREDLAATEKEEMAVLEDFLPTQMGDEELTTALKAIIEQTGASSPKDMGKVMGMATKQLAGQADGKRISGMVRQLLG